MGARFRSTASVLATQLVREYVDDDHLTEAVWSSESAANPGSSAPPSPHPHEFRKQFTPSLYA